MFISHFRPLRGDEVLPKQSYSEVIKDASLKTTLNSQESKETGESKSKSKKSKTHSSSKTKDKPSENNEKSGHKKKKSKPTKSENGDVDLLGTPVKDSKEKSNKKEKKEKKEKKSSKSKKSSTGESKSGYEEALGISTPSKEVY